MKYYLHDANAFNDEKITELFISYGYEGLGLFYTILEKLAQQEKPIKTNVLKSQLKVGKRLEKCWNFLESLELISSSDGETFNEQLLKYGEKYQIKKEKNRDKISKWRANKDNSKIVTGYEPSGNASKVNKSKVNKSKVNIFLIKIGNETFEKKASEIFQDEYRGLLDGLLMGKLKGADEKELLDRFDLEYPNYEFKDRNHFSNSLKSVFEKITKEKSSAKKESHGKSNIDAIREF